MWEMFEQKGPGLDETGPENLEGRRGAVYHLPFTPIVQVTPNCFFSKVWA